MTRVRALVGWLAGLGFLSVLVTPALGVGKASAWRDDFSGTSLDVGRWINAAGQAPGYLAGNHRGYYDPSHVQVSGGYLVIALDQDDGDVDGVPGVISRGGLVYTKSTYGYGTYEWRMRMSSTAPAPGSAGLPVSGSVSAGFNYVNNSQTEVDFEFNGEQPDQLFMSNWKNTSPRRDPTASQLTSSSTFQPLLTSEFKTYKFAWDSESVTFYVDDQLQARHVTNVPRTAANVMINHWGTNSPWWGGPATIGVRRYFYVDWVSFIPAP